MTLDISIERATPRDSAAIAVMVGALLIEIMTAAGVKAFNVDLEDTTTRAKEFLEREHYVVFVARDGARGKEAGFVALYESYALYAEGAFGTIPELYVCPAHRSKGVGTRLFEHAKGFGAARGWTRLEVTTPPLPQFERTLRFYERLGFSVTGGRKLTVAL